MSTIGVASARSVTMRNRALCLALLLSVVSVASFATVQSDSSRLVAERVIVRSAPTEAGLEKQFSRTRETLRDSPDFQKGDAGSHYRLGKKLHHAGDLTGAAEEFRAAIRLNPNFADAYRQLGVVLLDRHDFARAADAFRNSLPLQVGDAQTFYWLGRALMAQGEWVGASDALMKAAELNQEDAEAYADLGLVRMVQGDLRGAGAALRAAIGLNPSHANAHHLLDTLREFRDDPEEVARSARQILSTLFERE